MPISTDYKEKLLIFHDHVLFAPVSEFLNKLINFLIDNLTIIKVRIVSSLWNNI